MLNQLKYCFILLCVCLNWLQAQDIHFSQLNFSPLNLNPAFTGSFDGDYRAGAILRSQWSAVPVPYSTVSIMGDLRKKIAHQQMGAGILFNNDVSGDSKYSISQFYLPIAIHQYLKKDSTLLFSMGLQPGFSNIGFKTSLLSFDSQFDGDIYNPALPNGENFPLLSRTYFDLNGGFLIQYNFSQQSSLSGGFALSHITRPTISFFTNTDIRLDVKSNYFLTYSLPVQQNVLLNTEFILTKQGKFHESIFGLKASYILNEKEQQSINAGAYWRVKDAIILRAGYNIKQWQFGLSYDVNTSAFIAATNRRGAIEFGLIYIFKKEKIFTPKKRICPVYM